MKVAPMPNVYEAKGCLLAEGDMVKLKSGSAEARRKVHRSIVLSEKSGNVCLLEQGGDGETLAFSGDDLVGLGQLGTKLDRFDARGDLLRVGDLLMLDPKISGFSTTYRLRMAGVRLVGPSHHGSLLVEVADYEWHIEHVSSCTLVPYDAALLRCALYKGQVGRTVSVGHSLICPSAPRPRRVTVRSVGANLWCIDGGRSIMFENAGEWRHVDGARVVAPHRAELRLRRVDGKDVDEARPSHTLADVVNADMSAELSHMRTLIEEERARLIRDERAVCQRARRGKEEGLGEWRRSRRAPKAEHRSARRERAPPSQARGPRAKVAQVSPGQGTRRNG